MLAGNVTQSMKIARDITVRGQLRQQRKRQARLIVNHYRGVHKTQKALKCTACMGIQWTK